MEIQREQLIIIHPPAEGHTVICKKKSERKPSKVTMNDESNNENIMFLS